MDDMRPRASSRAAAQAVPDERSWLQKEGAPPEEVPVDSRQSGWRQRVRAKQKIIILLLLCLLGFGIRYYIFEQQSRSLDAYLGQSCRISGRVVFQRERAKGYEYYIQAEKIAFGQADFFPSHLKFQFYSSEKVQVNSQITAAGKLSALAPPKNPGEWDQKSYFKGKNIYYQLKKAEIKDRKVFRPNLMQRFREWAGRQSSRYLPEKEKGLFLSLFAGDRSGLDQELAESFKKTGVSHVLAVSGLHVGLLALLLNLVLKKLPLPYAVQFGIIMTALLFFTAFTGGQASTVRAVLMFGILQGSYFFNRAKEPKTAYLLTLLLLLLYNPFYLYDIGFLLSFISVGAILFLYPFLLADKPRYVRMMGLTVIIQVALLPVSSLFFHHFSLAAVLANLWIVPAISYFLGIGGVALLLSGFSTVAAQIMAGSGYYAAQAAMRAAALLAGLPFSEVPIRAMRPGEIALFYAIILAALLSRRKKLLWGLLFAVIIFIPYTWQPQLGMLNVGQAESMVIEYRNKTLVIDTGLTANKSTVTYLQYRGKHRIDMILLSHLDKDHAGGLENLLAAYPVGSIGIAESYRQLDGVNLENEELIKVRESYYQLLKLAAKYQVPVVYWQTGDRIEIADLGFQFLYPEAEEMIWTSNDFSLVAEMEYCGSKTLFTGDIGREVETLLLERGMLNEITVLKTAHHGSKYSSSPEFLAMTKPKLAIISCGLYNKYGHPSPLLMQELAERGTQSRVTAWDGAIFLHFSRNGEVIIDE